MKHLKIILFSLALFCCTTQEAVGQTKETKKEIIVYGSDSCHSCIDTKAFLKNKKIKFTYYDIDVNKKKEQEMLLKLQNAHISIHTLSLPVIDNKGDVFLNKGNFQEFLREVDKKIKKDEN